MDTIELLKKDHEAVRQLFAEFATAESEQDKLDIFDDIREQLIVHTRIEEEIFYPAVREINSGRGASQVEHALSEHQKVKAMLDKLDEMMVEVDAGFAETIRTLAQSVEQHVQEEESDIFASARKLGYERLSELGDRLQERKNQLMEEGIDQDEQSASK
jgi:hemerythrin-like domain-containing protein